MITEIKIDNLKSNNASEVDLNVLLKQKEQLSERFTSNPYMKFYTYVVDNKALGFIIFDLIYNRCELIDIYVLPEYRGRHIANKLMEFMIEYCIRNKAANITLEVKVNNFVAIKLYEKFQFIEKAVRKNYYKGTDGILMEKELM